MKVVGESEKRTRGDSELLQRETKNSAKNSRREGGGTEGEENEESANLGRERKGDMMARRDSGRKQGIKERRRDKR